MATMNLVIGHFKYVDDIKGALMSVRSQGFNDLEVFSPMPNHDLENAIYKPGTASPVRYFALLGAILGCLGGFLLTVWMSVDWPLRTSAKPIVAIPAFVIVAFECTILIGAIVTLISMFHFSRIPYWRKSPGFRPVFSNGTFGLSVRAPKESSDALRALMLEEGAGQVEVQYVR